MMEMMISASDRYFLTLSELDKDAYLSCFSTEVELHHPYGGEPFNGHVGLAKWFTGMERTWTEFAMRPLSQFLSGDQIAIQWQGTGSTGTGKTADFSGINVLTVADSGLITCLEGYWDLQSMLAQIS